MSTAPTRRQFFCASGRIALTGAALGTAALVSQVAPQRRSIHLAVGDDQWEPTQEELQEVLNWFVQAEQSPTGAIVATRRGVRVTTY